MTRIRQFNTKLLILSLITLMVTGCGSATDDSGSQATNLPTASINSEKDKSNQISRNSLNASLEKGTPEWTLRKIASLRKQPLAAEDETLTPQKIQTRFFERNQQILQLASSVIAVTSKKSDQEQNFNAAVLALMEARFQLASTGDKNEIKALYDDAEALFTRAPASQAAMTGAFTLVRVTQTLARKNSSDSKLVSEYVQQVQNFAIRFKKEESRAAAALSFAGRFCEAQGDLKNAFTCYALIPQQFPDSPFAPRASATLRRLSLAGKKLALEGDTIDGAFLTMNDYKNKVVLIVFWESESEQFKEDIPALKNAYAQLHKKGFDFLGVCLDENELAVDQFLEATDFPGRQLFEADRELRGSSNPIARYYGIRKLPTYWLVDQTGQVVSIQVKPNDLLNQASLLLK